MSTRQLVINRHIPMNTEQITNNRNIDAQNDVSWNDMIAAYPVGVLQLNGYLGNLTDWICFQTDQINDILL